MLRFHLLLPVIALVLSGCNKDKLDAEDLKIPRLMIEARGIQYGAMGGNVITLPKGGTRIAIQKEPLVNEFQIANVELVKVDLGLAILIQLTGQGARALYRGTVTNMGGRIVFTVNGNAIGARRIDTPISDGNYYTFVEIEDQELGQLVLDLKKSIVALRKL